MNFVAWGESAVFRSAVGSPRKKTIFFWVETLQRSNLCVLLAVVAWFRFSGSWNIIRSVWRLIGLGQRSPGRRVAIIVAMNRRNDTVMISCRPSRPPTSRNYRDGATLAFLLCIFCFHFSLFLELLAFPCAIFLPFTPFSFLSIFPLLRLREDSCKLHNSVKHRHYTVQRCKLQNLHTFRPELYQKPFGGRH